MENVLSLVLSGEHSFGKKVFEVIIGKDVP